MQLNQAVQSFVDGYFSTCRRSTKTQTAYRLDLAQFSAHVGPFTKVSEITPATLETWAKALVDHRYAPVSIRRKFAALRMFFSYWVRKGELDGSPLWRIRLDLATERKLPRSISAADAEQLLLRAWNQVEHVPEPGCVPRDPNFLAFRNVAAIELLFATGIRVGELVALDLADWNACDRAFIVKGKGSRQRLAILPDGRPVECLTAYLRCRLGLNLDHSALLVNASGRRLSTQGIARALARLAKSVGITTRVTPHVLRHTVATLLLRNGADIRVVQEVLGHASIAMTERYTHVSKEHVRATLDEHHPNNYLSIAIPPLHV